MRQSPEEFITKGEKVGSVCRCQREGAKSVLIFKLKKEKKIIMVLFFRPTTMDLVSGETWGTSDKEQSKRS